MPVLKKALHSPVKEQEKKEGSLPPVRSFSKVSRVMIIPRSAFYYKPKEKSLEQLKEEMDLRDQIDRICVDFPRYGYRTVTCHI